MHREQARRDRRRRLTIIAAAAAAVTTVTVVAPNHGGGSQDAAVSRAQLPGMQAGNPPWQPEYDSLPARLTALNLPPNGNESYHIHAHLAIHVNGKPLTDGPRYVLHPHDKPRHHLRRTRAGPEDRAVHLAVGE